MEHKQIFKNATDKLCSKTAINARVKKVNSAIINAIEEKSPDSSILNRSKRVFCCRQQSDGHTRRTRSHSLRRRRWQEDGVSRQSRHTASPGRKKTSVKLYPSPALVDKRLSSNDCLQDKREEWKLGINRRTVLYENVSLTNTVQLLKFFHCWTQQSGLSRWRCW